MVALDATIHAFTVALPTLSQRLFSETVDNSIFPNEIKSLRAAQKPIAPRGAILTVCQQH
jgi:hypothetical protein